MGNPCLNPPEQIEQHEQHGRHHQGHHQAQRQCHVPEGAFRAGQGDHDVHQCPTAAFLSARAACRIRTPESLILAMPLSPSVCDRRVSTASLAVSACPAIRLARTRIVVTMITATTTTTAPSPRPMYQEVVSAPISIPLPHASGTAHVATVLQPTLSVQGPGKCQSFP